MTQTTTRKKSGTCLGRRVQTWEVRTGGPTDERWVYVHWIEDADPRNGGWKAGQTTEHHISGDGRTASLVEIEPIRTV